MEKEQSNLKVQAIVKAILKLNQLEQENQKYILGFIDGATSLKNQYKKNNIVN